jgi:hypothetical protein
MVFAGRSFLHLADWQWFSLPPSQKRQGWSTHWIYVAPGGFMLLYTMNPQSNDVPLETIDCRLLHVLSG